MSILSKKARDGIEVAFGDEDDPIRFLAFSVGRARYVDILSAAEPAEGEERTDDEEAAFVRTLLELLELDDDGTVRPVTAEEVDTLLTAPEWSGGEIAQLIGAVRLANEGHRGRSGKASARTPSASPSSAQPKSGD